MSVGQDREIEPVFDAGYVILLTEDAKKKLGFDISPIWSLERKRYTKICALSSRSQKCTGIKSCVSPLLLQIVVPYRSEQ